MIRLCCIVPHALLVLDVVLTQFIANPEMTKFFDVSVTRDDSYFALDMGLSLPVECRLPQR